MDVIDTHDSEDPPILASPLVSIPINGVTYSILNVVDDVLIPHWEMVLINFINIYYYIRWKKKISILKY